MVLCKYFDLNGIDVLRNCRLRITNPLTFNDPFEFSSYIDGSISFSDFKRYYKHPINIDRWYYIYKDLVGAKNKDEFKKMIRNKDKKMVYNNFNNSIVKNMNKELDRLRLNFSKTCRILCFSDPNLIEPYEEILMWAHYSDSHKGLKIHFDADKFKLRSVGPHKVTYQKERTRLDSTKIMLNDKDTLDDFSKSLSAKSIAWSYEHEYRWFIIKEECFDGTKCGLEFDFIKINPEVIMRVDIGARCPDEKEEEILKALSAEEFAHVVAKKATLDSKEYKINFEDIK